MAVEGVKPVMRWSFLLLLSCAPGSIRITATQPPPAQCDALYCGGIIPVSTQLAPSDALTESECRALCGSWCAGAVAISGKPGCHLLSRTEVYCGGTVYDCGYFPSYCGPENCSGCCLADGSCRLSAGTCNGVSCADCAQRQKCSTLACGQLSACGAQLEAEPRLSACADADGGVDSSWDSTAACVAACDASDAGALVGCALTLPPGCDDGGSSFAAACTPDAGAPSACLASCRADRDACDRACTKASFASCMSCATSCGLSLAVCAAACPP